MKVAIDTISKTITLEESINLGEFVDKLQEWFNIGEWREFTLQIVNKITIEPVIPNYPHPIEPYYGELSTGAPTYNPPALDKINPELPWYTSSRSELLDGQFIIEY